MVGKIICLLLFLSIGYPSFSEKSVKISFSKERGFYYKEFSLKLSCENEQLQIYYSTNGKDPTPINSTLYKVPISIKTTTIVKAVVYQNNKPLSEPEVHSYIFPDSVIRQPAKIPLYQVNASSGFNFEMDPEIVNNPLYKDSMINSLLSIPTVSFGLDTKNFYGFYTGINTSKASIEILYPDKKYKNEQVYCGLRPRSHIAIKRSLRVLFKKEFGAGKFQSNLLRTAPLNSENAPISFDNLIFRAGTQDTWSVDLYHRSKNVSYTRDQWYRDNQILMTGEGVRGTFVHLYINGLYMGLYNVAELPDEKFLETHYGGTESDWFSTAWDKSEGDSSRYLYIFNNIVNKDLSLDSNYSELLDYVDIKNFVDYLILSWYIAMRDWPLNNFRAGYNNRSLKRLKYLCWDGEISFDEEDKRRIINQEFVKIIMYDNSRILNLWYSVKKNPEFRILLADRVYKHCFNNGSLTPENATKSWMELNNFIRLAILSESARWGDAVATKPRDRDTDWIKEVNRVNDILKTQNLELVRELRDLDLYPEIEPPTVERKITKNGILFRIHNPNDSGQVYYTVSADDPRYIGGKINPLALISDTEFTEIGTKNGGILRARVKKGDEWSALLEIPFYVSNMLTNLQVVQIMQNPDSFPGYKRKSAQYIELKNIGDSPIDISGIKIIGDINYTFPPNSVMDKFQSFKLAEDISCFNEVYGSEPKAKFQGKLENGGGLFSVLTPDSKKLFEVEYPPNSYPPGYSLTKSSKQKSQNLIKADEWVPLKVQNK